MSMILLSLLGVLLTASANDWVVLFFAIELVSVPTYVLIALSRDDRRSPESSVKYFFLGALSAAILAYGLSFLYGASGTTTIYSFGAGGAAAALSHEESLTSPALLGLLLVFGGLLFKIAAVPFHVYAADVYEGAASPVTGMLGFVPKIAGFVALIKVFSVYQWDLPTEFVWVVWLVAAATMTVGNVLALLQRNAKRILAYSSIAHTGYMLVALLVGPIAGRGPMHDGVAALLFYIAVYGVMNLGAFAFLGAYQSRGKDVETLEDLAGFSAFAPAAALGLAICVFSLMGFPPTAGLIGKVYVFSSAFTLGRGHPLHGPLIALAILGVLNAAIGAAYYLRIVSAVYVGATRDDVQRVGGAPIRVGLVISAAGMLFLFAWPGGLAKAAKEATAVVHRSIRPVSTRITSESRALPPARGDAHVDRALP
jgi:NADH-quinone oxidoreductase subunit N